MIALPQVDLRRFLRPFLVVLVFFYLAFHAVSGERGVVAMFKSSRELALLEMQLAQVQDKKTALESKVSLLNQKSVDLDLLDEQARQMLGVAAPDEVVIIRKQ